MMFEKKAEEMTEEEKIAEAIVILKRISVVSARMARNMEKLREMESEREEN
jgi:hypothetical protein